MKTRAFMMIVLALSLTLSAQPANTSVPKYSAQQITPVAGQVVHPGEVVKVSWTSTLPNMGNDLYWCEIEVLLSLDGGRTYSVWISPYLDAKAKSFYWTVPNTPTRQAVLDIRFGCEGYYPESPAPQLRSMFTIADGSD
jgi:hypothetical protein